jgi:hypothetical protein
LLFTRSGRPYSTRKLCPQNVAAVRFGAPDATETGATLLSHDGCYSDPCKHVRDWLLSLFYQVLPNSHYNDLHFNRNIHSIITSIIYVVPSSHCAPVMMLLLDSVEDSFHVEKTRLLQNCRTQYEGVRTLYRQLYPLEMYALLVFTALLKSVLNLQ